MNPEVPTAEAGQPGRDEHAAPLPPLPPDVYCPDCGYDLRGLISARCPECGFSLDAVRSPEPQIPWVHRRTLGRFRAYWATVFAVLFRTRRFCAEMVRPVSYRDAQRFRWVTVVWAYVWLASLALTWFALDPDGFVEMLGDVGPWPLLVASVSVLMYLLAATGLPSYFFHPRFLSIERQNRAVALSCYACAPLAGVPVPVLLVWLGAASVRPHSNLDIALALAAAGASLGIVFIWWSHVVRIARCVLRRPARVVRIAIAVPVLWLAAGVLILLGIPLVCAFVAIVFYSLG